MLLVYHSDHVALPLPPGHFFPGEKYRLARERVAGLVGELAIELRPAPAATREDLLRVHTAEHVAKVIEGRLSEQEQREIGFPWSPGMVERSLHSVGATLGAGRAVFGDDPSERPVWGAHLAGGTHHASADRARGFCVFNDVAVTIRALQGESRFKRAMIFDCDVHQGDGSAAIFADDPSVFTVSLHGEKNYPRIKPPSDLDCPLPDACEDRRYLDELDRVLAEAFDRFDPEAFFYIAGADPHAEDRYGRMRLTREGLAERDRRVLSECRRRGLPVVATMGGGYARDVELVAEIYAATIETLARLAP